MTTISEHLFNKVEARASIKQAVLEAKQQAKSDAAKIRELVAQKGFRPLEIAIVVNQMLSSGELKL